MWTAALIVIAGCKGGDGAKQEPTKEPAAARDAAIPPDAAPVAVAAGPDAGSAPDMTGRPRFKLAEGEKLTGQSLEKLYLALTDCTVIWQGFDSRYCPEEQALSAATALGSEHRLDDSKAEKALELEVAKKMLGHASPAVRYGAAKTLSFNSNWELVAGALASEQDPMALRALVFNFRSSATAHPKIAEQLLRLADSPIVEVRRDVAIGLGSAQGVAGAFEKAADRAEHDADVMTRGSACESAGELGDPRALDLFAKLLVPSSNPSVWDHCLEGLISMWTHGENHNAEAYRRSLALIAESPVMENVTWVASSNVGHIAEAMKERPDEWKARPFVKLSQIKSALTKVARSAKATYWARSNAVGGLAQLGATKRELQAIRKTLPELLDENLAALARTIDEAIAEAR